MIEKVTPAEAFARMSAGARADAAGGRVVYLDVRSEAEFALGHPAGAWNIPIGLPASEDADATFVTFVTLHISPDDHLILGCASGTRSARAARLLEDAGLEHLADQAEGYEGKRDAFGSRVVPGWTGAGLPRETGEPADRSWPALQRLAPRS